jgi:hypothetical protein
VVAQRDRLLQAALQPTAPAAGQYDVHRGEYRVAAAPPRPAVGARRVAIQQRA